MSANVAQDDNAVFIRQQIDRTRTQVKFVDLFSGFILLAIGLIGWLLLVAIVDAWLFDLGMVGRLFALLVLAGGSAFIFWQRILPALRGNVNPLFAAKTIEDGEPGYHNSLINLLMLRKNRIGVSPAMVTAMEAQAADRLGERPVDGVVDKTYLIKTGYVLAALFIVAVGYAILSPKNPFQSVARIIAPFAQLARPSRVDISAIEPGNAEVIVGNQLNVSAQVTGLSTDETVRVIYSTVDGQAIDRVVEMQLDDNGLKYTAAISPTTTGVQQDLVYRIEAGDAVSPDFQITARQAPAMFVERLEIVYPPYTQLGRRTQTGAGDIDAIEGTHVTVVAQSNLPMAAAYIEFDVEPAQNGQPVRRPETIPMTINGQTATGKIVLEMRADRKTPMHSGYRVRFMTADRETNEEAARHPIEVRPDLPPEITILQPAADPASVAENGELEIQVRAIDPDYGLTAIHLKAKSGEASLFEKALLQTQPGESGQVVKSFLFRPREFGLIAGDEVLYRAAAADNRVSSTVWLAEPNEARTRYRKIRVTASSGPDRRPNESTGNERTSEEPNNPASDPKDPASPQNEANPDPKNNPAQDESDPKSQPQQGEKTDDGASSKSDKPETGETGDPQKGNESSETPQNNGGENSSDESEGQKGENSDEAGGNSGAGESGGTSEQTQNSAENGGQNGGGSSTEQSTEPSDSPSQGTNNGGETSSQSGNPGGQSQQSSGKPGDSNEKLHDGEVIERLNELLEEIKNLKNEGGKEGDNSKPQNPGADSESANGGKPDQPEMTPEQKERLKELSERLEEYQKQKAEEEKQGGGVGTGQSRPNENTDSSDGGTSDADGNTDQSQKPKNPSEGSGAKPENQDATGNKQEGAAGKPNQSEPGEEGAGGATPKANGQGNPKPQPGESDTGDPAPAATANENETDTGPQESSEAGVEPEKGNPSDKPPEGNQGAATSEPGESAGTENQDNIPPSGGNETPKPGEAEEARESGKPQSSSNESTNETEGDGEGFAGGEEAGGEQSSGKPGEGGSGASSASDTGAGAANEKGDGPTGNRAGDGDKSETKTGNTGNEEGPGSKTEAGGEKAGASGQEGDASETKPGSTSEKGDRGEASKSGRGTGEQKGGSRSDNTGGGDPTEGSSGDPTGGASGELSPADKANLEYAREATDLALDLLESQADKPDDALLEDLNMSPAEMKAFLQRWRNMKRTAKEGAAGRSELDESLRNLGLRKPADRRNAAAVENDSARGFRDQGSRTPAPAEYLEQFRAFKQGAARGGN